MIAAGVHAYFVGRNLETTTDNDQRGFYKHLNYLKSTVGLEGNNARSEQAIRDENGTRCYGIKCEFVNDG